ncbi:ribosomal protein L32 [Mesorhizobium sp. B2-8-9]|uniref:ribosomal protein L32 n=1 Tax=Mesorhizobium sp. B2-8-9 TaxID=2589899 RepID=UPI00112B6E1B|nr:ribosomal protein L32 [Mesorhizobium sp. B2-8-9]TPI86365.1 hypothetical protein FJ423_00645 [Mesorhizobium sp. B2-8-9]
MPRLWNLPVNWRESYSVTLTLKTEPITSRSRREQRRAWRQTPRKQISHLVTCPKERYLLLAQHMSAGQGGEFYVPDMSLVIYTTSAAPVTGDRLTVEEAPFWAVAGTKAILMTPGLFVLKTISSVDGSDIVFEEMFDEAWLPGAKIVPALLSHVQTQVDSRAIGSSVVELTVLIDVEPGTEVVETPDLPTTVFNGREVFELKPNWAEPLGLTFVSGRETVDYDMGRTADFLPSAFPEEQIKAAYLGRGLEEIKAIRHFFLRMMGQQDEFYMPTWMRDIVPKNALTSAGTTMTVAGTDFAAAYNDTVHKAIAVFLNDGTVRYRKVSSLAVAGSDSVITCVGTWGSNIPLTSIRMVSWMPVWRLLSDGLVLEFLTQSVAQTTLSMKTLEDLAGD